MFQPAWWPSQVEWGEALLQVSFISTQQLLEITLSDKFKVILLLLLLQNVVLDTFSDDVGLQKLSEQF